MRRSAAITMPNRTSLVYAVSIMLLAVFYQYFLKDLFFMSLGLFRRLQYMEDFHFTCRPIRHEKQKVAKTSGLMRKNVRFMLPVGIHTPAVNGAPRKCSRTIV